jgi:hypothetical protein
MITDRPDKCNCPTVTKWPAYAVGRDLADDRFAVAAGSGIGQPRNVDLTEPRLLARPRPSM